MNDGFSEVIALLERKKAAIDRALAALRDVDDVETLLPAIRKRGRPVKPKGGLTEEGRRKLSETMKQRWAERNAAAKKTTKKAPFKKRAAKEAA
jgi:hypothetical protein